MIVSEEDVDIHQLGFPPVLPRHIREQFLADDSPARFAGAGGNRPRIQDLIGDCIIRKQVGSFAGFRPARVKDFIRRDHENVGVDQRAAAQSAGTLRAQLEAAGRPIGAYDLLIAGQALRHEFTLVTANVSEFRRVKHLAWQNWARTS